MLLLIFGVIDMWLVWDAVGCSGVFLLDVLADSGVLYRAQEDIELLM